MAKHRKYDLLDKIVQAVNDCDWNVLYISDIFNHPFVLKIYNESESYLVRIYIWNLTHGGGAKRPKDEYRIQITGTDQFVKNSDELTLILGWWPDIGVFAGFDFNKHTGKLGFSPSIQIREESLRKAHINGISPCDKGNKEIAIAFRPDFLIDYLRNLEGLHQFGESQKDLEILESVADNKIELNEAVLEQVTQPRQVIVKSIHKKLRDNSFKARVLTAYGHKCAFSGMQLRLVEAAHIIPVSHASSTDETCNGIALSALYHRAFDKSLVTFNENYQLLVNQNEVAKLKAMNLDAGLEQFVENLRPIIHVPPAVNDRPNVHLIKEANLLRGWKV
jgi:putative restriction endonuclease